MVEDITASNEGDGNILDGCGRKLGLQLVQSLNLKLAGIVTAKPFRPDPILTCELQGPMELRIFRHDHANFRLASFSSIR